MHNRKTVLVTLLVILLLIAGVSAFNFRDDFSQQSTQPQIFNADRAYEDVLQQVGFGPRTPGSEGHSRTVDYILSELEAAGWETSLQETSRMGHPIRNIIASRGKGQPHVILGAHYDTRFFADQDPDPQQRDQPVPGANDGASGVAVLLELARILPEDLNEFSWAESVTLVFFDAEDQGRIEGWDWILGSRAYAESLAESPAAVVVVDMIGDADLNIYREGNSHPELVDEIWGAAASLGYADQFVNAQKYNILDDHLPFIEKGIPAVDLIDFDYPYWHTVADTPDKVAPESLKMVGETLMEWLRTEK